MHSFNRMISVNNFDIILFYGFFLSLIVLTMNSVFGKYSFRYDKNVCIHKNVCGKQYLLYYRIVGLRKNKLCPFIGLICTGITSALVFNQRDYDLI